MHNDQPEADVCDMMWDGGIGTHVKITNGRVKHTKLSLPHHRTGVEFGDSCGNDYWRMMAQNTIGGSNEHEVEPKRMIPHWTAQMHTITRAKYKSTRQIQAWIQPTLTGGVDNKYVYIFIIQIPTGKYDIYTIYMQ